MNKTAVKLVFVFAGAFILSCENPYVQEILRDGALLDNISLAAQNGAGEEAEINFGLNPGFTPNVFTYYGFVPRDTQYVTVTGIPRNGETVSYRMNDGPEQNNGTFPFLSADPETAKNSSVTLTVNREYMDASVYTVTLYRKQPTWLTTVYVRTDVGGTANFDLDPGFNPSILDYAAGVNQNAASFSLKAEIRAFDNLNITATYSGDWVLTYDGYYSYDFPNDPDSPEYLKEKTIVIRVSYPQEDPLPLEYRITVRRPEPVAATAGQEAYFAIGGGSDHYFQQGEPVSFRAVPPFGHTLQKVQAITHGGAEVNLVPAFYGEAGKYGNDYSFIMPAEEVTLKGTWNAIPASADTNVRYVWEGGAPFTTTDGQNGDAKTWARATNDLQALIDAFNPAGPPNNYEIWIARGTLHPIWAWVDGPLPKPPWASAINIPENQTKDNWCFVLKNGIKIYGGFRGIEETGAQKAARDIAAFETVLSGAMENFGNTRHLVIAANITEDTFFDGLTITDSMAGGRPETITIDGLTFNILAGATDTQPNEWTGAGIVTYKCTRNLVFSRLTIRDNFTMFGAGVYNYFSSPTFRKCVIKNNSAYSWGGAMDTYGTQAEPSSPLLEDCELSANLTNGNAGGIYATYTRLFLRNTKINGNWGGGLYGSNNSLDMIGGEILDNKPSGASYGGGVYFSGTDTRIYMTGVRVSGNVREGSCGGLYASATGTNSILALTNVEISGNYASGGNGGGIYTNINNTHLTNVTIAGNQTQGTTGGGGIYYAGSLPGAEINNTVIWGNADGNADLTDNGIKIAIPANSPVFTNSLVENHNPAGTFDGGDNLSADPLFASPAGEAPSSGGNYKLQSGSPAENAGDNALYESGVYMADIDGDPVLIIPYSPSDPDNILAKDLAGQTRKIGGDIDMGAYEVQ
jgi:hypothetical protein